MFRRGNYPFRNDKTADEAKWKMKFGLEQINEAAVFVGNSVGKILWLVFQKRFLLSSILEEWALEFEFYVPKLHVFVNILPKERKKIPILKECGLKFS